MKIKILNDIESKSLKDIWKTLELNTSIDKSDKIHIFKTAIFYHTIKDVFKLSLPINDVYKILDMRCQSSIMNRKASQRGCFMFL